jgi:hypothetical protein
VPISHEFTKHFDIPQYGQNSLAPEEGKALFPNTFFQMTKLKLREQRRFPKVTTPVTMAEKLTATWGCLVANSEVFVKM